MAVTPGYPATLRLEGRRVLVVGGGTVATRRIPALVDAGAVIDVVAPDASTDIRKAAAAGRIRWRQRRFQPRDLLEPQPAWLVHATTKSPAASIATAGESWLPGVYVFVRNSPPSGFPCASK